MRILSLVLLGLFISIATSHLQLRKQHDIPFLDSLNPLQTASLVTGDYSVLFPQAIRPIVRKVIGQQEKQGPAGYLQGLTGGNNGGGGGLLGGLGGLLGGGSNSNSNSGGGIMDSIGGMFGEGNSNSNSGGGIMDSIGGIFGGNSESKKQQKGFLGNLFG